MSSPKRVNKNKPEILDEMARRAKVEKFKDMGRRLFPLLTTDTIYDAQTAIEAGYRSSGQNATYNGVPVVLCHAHPLLQGHYQTAEP